MLEAAVCSVDALKDGEMRSVSVGDTDVLLARVEGRYHAVYGHCTHYGAPLADGALSGDLVVCPWHHACFRLSSGDQVEPPGLDSLPRFDVREEEGQVVVRVPEDAAPMRTPEMAGRDPDDDRTFVVLGAGSAGAYAVEALRAAGFGGRLVMITKESHPPYDRPNCSKAYLAGEAEEAWMILRTPDFYEARDIELMTERTATEVDAASKTIAFADGATMPYDALLLCTGCRPLALDVPGANLDRIHTLRSYEDSRTLREKAREAERVVVVGASFIGMEAAQAPSLSTSTCRRLRDATPPATSRGFRTGAGARRCGSSTGAWRGSTVGWPDATWPARVDPIAACRSSGRATSAPASSTWATRRRGTRSSTTATRPSVRSSPTSSPATASAPWRAPVAARRWLPSSI